MKITKFDFWGVTIILLLCLAGSSIAASFDCTKASSRVDKAICNSPQISQLDSELDVAYKKVLAVTNEPEAAKLAQRSWLKENRNSCDTETCFITVYQQRIASLNSASGSIQENVPVNTELEEQVTAKANADADADAEAETALVAEDEVKKAAEQAAIAAAEAQLKVKEIEDKKAKELEEKNAANLQRSNDQKQKIAIIAIFLTICLVIGVAAWFWMRRHAKSMQNQTTEKSTHASVPITSNTLKQQTVDDAKTKFASATSIIKEKNLKAAGQFNEELIGINEARSKAFEGVKEGASGSVIDRAKTLSRSFKQKGIVIGVVVLVILALNLLIPKHKIATPEEKDQISQAINLRGHSEVKDKQQGFTMMRKLAESGIPDAMFYLGLMYEDGDGTEKDMKNAMNWYSKGADNGDASSLQKMGHAYFYGSGVETDEKKGLSLLKKSAELGDISSKWEYEGLTHTTLTSASEARDSLGHTTAESKAIADEAANSLNQDQAQRLSATLNSFHGGAGCQAIVSTYRETIGDVREFQHANKYNGAAYNLVEGMIREARNQGCQ